MIGRREPNPSHTIISAARSGRIASQRLVQATILATGRTVAGRMGIGRDPRRNAEVTCGSYHRAVPGQDGVDRSLGPRRGRETARGEAMTGPIGLHGGGEYLAGDEPFLDALLAAALGSVEVRTRLDDVSGHGIEAAIGTIRVVIVPTAAGRGQPDRAAETGRAAFEERAAATGRPVSVGVARIVDAASADDHE